MGVKTISKSKWRNSNFRSYSGDVLALAGGFNFKKMDLIE